MENNKNEQQTVGINIDNEVAKGNYSNLAVISHSSTEFVLDFASMLPGRPQPQVVSRIILHPEHAKKLLAALNDNIAKYEKNFGPIGNTPKGTFNMAEFPFGKSNGTKS